MNRCPEPSCSFFNRVLPNNANVCPMCGTHLGQMVETMTPATLDRQQQTFVSKPLQESDSTSSVSASRPRLKFTHPSGQDFYLSGEYGILGRSNPQKTSVPEIDLTGVPHDKIVSRSHARLYWDEQHQAYMIIDHSRNGSYLNGNLLSPGSCYPLSHGNELQLGQEKLICLQVQLC
jgi:hypothetical protein